MGDFIFGRIKKKPDSFLSDRDTSDASEEIRKKSCVEFCLEIVIEPNKSLNLIEEERALKPGFESSNEPCDPRPQIL